MTSLSEGCMTMPAVTASKYSPKGRYEKVSDLEVCKPVRPHLNVCSHIDHSIASKISQAMNHPPKPSSTSTTRSDSNHRPYKVQIFWQPLYHAR